MVVPLVSLSAAFSCCARMSARCALAAAKSPLKMAIWARVLIIPVRVARSWMSIVARSLARSRSSASAAAISSDLGAASSSEGSRVIGYWRRGSWSALVTTFFCTAGVLAGVTLDWARTGTASAATTASGRERSSMGR
jgi:hypothetical protein